LGQPVDLINWRTQCCRMFAVAALAGGSDACDRRCWSLGQGAGNHRRTH